MWMAKLDLLVHRDLCYLQHQQPEKDRHISYKAHCCVVPHLRGGVSQVEKGGFHHDLNPRTTAILPLKLQLLYSPPFLPVFWSSVMKYAFRLWGSDTAWIEGAANQPSIKFLSSVTIKACKFPDFWNRWIYLSYILIQWRCNSIMTGRRQESACRTMTRNAQMMGRIIRNNYQDKIWNLKANGFRQTLS